MMITHKITVLETVWTLVASFGLFFTGSLALKAYYDMEWLITTAANGDHDLRRYIALTSVLIFMGGFLTQLGYVAVGVIAMTQPNPHGGKIHPSQIATSSIFIIASIIGTILAGLIFVRRERAVKLIQEKLEKHENV